MTGEVGDGEIFGRTKWDGIMYCKILESTVKVWYSAK